MRYNLPSARRILAVEDDNYRTKTYTLDGALDAMPGQFVMLWLPGFDEKPFSLVNADPITVMITAVGPFTKIVHQQKKVGDQLWVRGPFGVGFSMPDPGTRIALIGGGYGVAPLYWLASQCLNCAVDVAAIIGARVARDVLYLLRFHSLQAQYPTQVQTIVTTEDGSLGTSGLVTDVLGPFLHSEPLEVDAVYACGPHAMLAAIETICRQSGVPAQLSWEAYMRCAVGICGSCEHQGRLLCLDGPVLTVPARS